MQQKKLRFREDGTFTIAQITDIHGICRKTSDTTNLIEGVLDKEKPDLVVFTGDQIKGYGLSYLTGDKRKKVERAIDNYTEPVDRRNIPFLVTFGNHDPQVGYTCAEQMDMYYVFKNCYRPDKEDEYAPGTFNVPIYDKNGDAPVFNIYMIDTGSMAPEGGYETLAPEKIAWYRSVRDKLYEKWGHYIPSVVFQHFPVEEIYNLYDEVDKKHPDAVKAFRTRKGRYYKLKDEFAGEGVKLYEPSSISDVNSGEFEAVKEKDDVFAMFFGHDHQNNFIGTYEGIDMGYGPSCGFNEYGNGVERGIRILKFREDDPRHYTSFVDTYRMLFGKRVKRPIQKGFYDRIPTSVDAAIPLVIKSLLLIAAIITGIVLLVKHFS